MMARSVFISSISLCICSMTASAMRACNDPTFINIALSPKMDQDGRLFPRAFNREGVVEGVHSTSVFTGGAPKI